MKWLPISEYKNEHENVLLYLPETKEIKLGWGSLNCYFGFEDEQEMEFYFDYDAFKCHPTHFMKLPDIPTV